MNSPLLNSPRLMTHIVAFFPDRETSYRIAEAMIDEGSRFLEVQFPFSDPTGDGPLIEEACQAALRGGFTTDRGFAFLQELAANIPALRKGRAEVFLMTYASILFARGVKRFVREARQAGVRGLIIPDLPLDSDEGLRVAADECGVHMVPVLASNARPERIRLVLDGEFEYIYCALRPGITGVRTALGEENIAFLGRVGAGGAKILAGFGIVERSQIEALSGHAHAAVIGSAFLRSLGPTAAMGGNSQDSVGAVRRLMRELLAGNT